MPKLAKPLKPLEVSRITSPGWHAVGVVSGLGLNVVGNSRSWVLRVVVHGKRRSIGLGPFPEVGVGLAHDKAREMKEQIRNGIDPLVERRLAVEVRRAGLREAQASLMTFQKCAEDYIEANRSGWANAKHAAQWESTLRTWAYPKIGDRPVGGIVTTDVMEVLTQAVGTEGPLWNARTETASRLRQRIALILDAAKARGLRVGDNPADWRGSLASLLPKPSKVSKVVHHAALPWRQMPEFITKLKQQQGTAAEMLHFAILTACRSGEVRGATWAEVDLENGTWTVPAGRMKAGKEHRVALSADAVALLKARPVEAEQPLIFPSPRGKEFSDAAMTALLKRMNVPVTAHGFRSSFRDWVAEATSFPGDMAEMALAHSLSSAVEAAYRRGDMLERRRELMDAWAGYCAAKPANVTVLHAVAA